MNFPQHGYLSLRYILATDGSLISITFTLPQKYLMPGRRYLLESTSPEFIMIQCEIHCPLLPTPLLDRNEMCLKLKWNTSHAATVGPRFASIPGVKSIHYLSSWPVSWPPLQLSCWTAIALNSLGLPQLTNDSQLLSKTGADNKGLILNNAVVVIF